MRRLRARVALVLVVSVVLSASAAAQLPSAIAAPVASPRSDPSGGAGSQVVTSRPDVVSARLAAAAQVSRVEVTSLDTEFATTYANADGTLTTDESLAPVRVLQADGSWAAVDYDLQHVDGGWSPKVSPVPVTFSDGGDPNAVTLGEGSKQLGLTWDVTLPAPSVDGPTATYDLGGGQSLVLTATPDGFEQSLVLTQVPTALPNLKLPLDESGLTPQDNGNGGYNFLDAAGTVVFSMPVPVMYDANSDPDDSSSTDAPTPVSTKLITTGAGPRLDLSPSLSWLQDPSRVYPVTIDPSVDSNTGASDMYVESDMSTPGNGTEDRVGMYNGAAARSYLRFPSVSGIVGKHVLSASLNVWNSQVSTCSPATPIYATTLAGSFSYSSTTWSNKPSNNASPQISASFAHGHSGCGAAAASLDVTKLAAAWAGTPGTGAGAVTNYGMQVNGHEASGAPYWWLCSFNYSSSDANGCTSVSRVPHLVITYNSLPGTPSALAVAPDTVSGSTNYTNTDTPRLSAKIGDADGGSMSATFTVYNSSGTAVTSGKVTGTAGTTQTWTVPSGKITADGNYTFKVVGNDGTDSGPTSAAYAFSVDTTAPPAPTVSSTTWPSTASGAAWGTATSGTISWTATAAAKYQYMMDNGAWSTTSSGSASFTVGTDEQHTLQVQALDAAGNTSPVASYTFGVGTGALTSPAAGASSAKDFLLDGAAQPSTPWVSYQWRLGATGNFATVPAANVTNYLDGSAAPTSWPWVSSANDSYVWNAQATVPGDGDLQIEVCFATDSSGTGATCQTDPTDVQLSAGDFSASTATQQVGPGELSLNSGDFQVSAGDVDVPAYNDDLSVGRSFDTLHPISGSSDPTNPSANAFGPGWTADIEGPSEGAAGAVVKVGPNNADVTLTEDGGEESFAHPTTAGSTITYTDIDDPESSVVLTLSGSTPSTLVLTDSDDSVTTWKYVSGQWQVVSVVPAESAGSASQNTSSFFYYTSNLAQGAAGLLREIVAPSPTGADCSAVASNGCRALSFTYAPAPGASTSTLLSTVSLLYWDTATNTTKSVQVAAYDYSNGYLADAYDPRISPALKTAYTYDSNGRLSTVTPPGLAPWTLHYDTAGRLSSLTRPDPSGQTATTTIVYDVPISGSNAPISLTYADVSSWDQFADSPVTGTAIFDPNHVPSDTSLAGLTSNGDWTYASLTYMDYLGNPTNTAGYGAGAWQINSSMYDGDGDVFWNLTADNRDQALAPTSSTDPWVAAQNGAAVRAEWLATWTFYDADGNQTLTGGPVHPVMLDNGSTVDARDADYIQYDQGAPSGEDMELQTSDTTYAYEPNGTTADSQTSTTGYSPAQSGDPSGWDTGDATTSTDPGGLVTTTRYNAAGQVIAQQLPYSTSPVNTQAERETLSTYYTATGSGSCVNPSLVGLLCSTAPDGQPGTGSPLPITTYNYDAYQNPTSVTQTYGTGSSQVVRTSTTSYDAAERKIGSSVTVTPASAGGTALPAVTFGYDPSTGLPTTTSTTTGGTTTTLSRGYDTVGRQTSYTDATGVTSTTSYDLAGNVTSRYDGKNTTSYTIDGAGSGEHRGMVTSENIGVSGWPSTFTASYDGDGNLTSETYPNGLVASTSLDNADQTTDLNYAMSGTSWLDFPQTSNELGQVITQSSPESHQTFGYDGSDRLTHVQDTYTDPSSDTTSCATRIYAFDADSNRSSLNSYPDAGDNSSSGDCSTSTTPTTTSYTYDAADRLTSDTAGVYTYDGLGRATTIPAGDAQGIGAHASITGNATIAYYANDMVASETQGSATDTFTLDPEQNRIATQSETSGTSTTTTADHYSGDSDSPSWTTAGSSWTENDLDPTGNLAAEVTPNGVELQLADSHDDIIATCADSASTEATDSYTETNEYGNPRAPATEKTTYGWLGGDLRSSNDLAGLTLMGARLYDPLTGRFGSADPIENGNANAYIYPDDPVGCFDTSGKTLYTNDIFGNRILLSNEFMNHILPHGLFVFVIQRGLKIARTIVPVEDNTLLYEFRAIKTDCNPAGCTNTIVHIHVIVLIRQYPKPFKAKTAYCRENNVYIPVCPYWVNAAGVHPY